MVKVASVDASFSHSSTAVKVTVTLPVSAQSSERLTEVSQPGKRNLPKLTVPNSKSRLKSRRAARIWFAVYSVLHPPSTLSPKAMICAMLLPANGPPVRISDEIGSPEALKSASAASNATFNLATIRCVTSALSKQVLS